MKIGLDLARLAVLPWVFVGLSWLAIGCSEQRQCCRCEQTFAERLKATRGYERSDLLNKEIRPRLRPGMRGEQVVQIAGYPDNMDCKYVWLWVCDRRFPSQLPETRREIEWSCAGRRYGADYYLFFSSDGVLLTPLVHGYELCRDAWTSFHGMKHGLTEEEFEEAMGPRPDYSSHVDSQPGPSSPT